MSFSAASSRTPRDFEVSAPSRRADVLTGAPSDVHAPVDPDDLPGDVATLVGAREGTCAGDVVGSAGPTERGHLAEDVHAGHVALLGAFARHGRVHDRGRNRIHRDAVAGKLT